MYDFGLTKDEKVIEIFEDIWIAQEEKEKNTTIALTNKRLLFLAYNKNDSREDLRVGRGLEYIRLKEVYYSIDLKDIKKVSDNKKIYIIELADGNNIEFDNDNLFKQIKKMI